MLKLKQKKAKCENFIEDITDIAIQNGGNEVILHGKHRKKLEHVNVLLLVEGDEGVQNTLVPVAKAAVKHGIFGSINVRAKENFKNDFEDAKKFFTDHGPKQIKRYKRKGDRFVFVSQ